MTKVFISAKLNPEGTKVLKNAGFKVTESEPLNGSDLTQALSGYDALIVRSETKVGEEVFQACPALKVVGRAGTGVDNIDVGAATRSGVIVMNAPGGNTITTAEHTFALMMASARNVAQGHKKLCDGEFDRKLKGVELENKTLGILGFGQIGRVLARKALGFGMHVIAYDPYCPEDVAKGLSVELLSINELLPRADVVSIHVPKTEETTNLINATTIKRMKRGAILINCARGGLVDEEAVRQALDAGTLASVGLDVYATEPPPVDHPLVNHPKCVTTPHLGASTAEAQVNVARIVAEEIVAYFETGAIRGAVNLPAISPQAYTKIAPFVDLAEHLGSFIAQASRTDAITEFKLDYRGAVANHNTDYVLRAAVAGYLKHRSEDANTVNALEIAKRFGFRVSETHHPETGTGLGTLRVTIASKLGEKSIEGNVYDAQTARLSRYDSVPIDARAEGTMLLTRNDDMPGVIGVLGTYLGTAGVNIGSFHLGRKPSKDEALALMSIDASLSNEQLRAIEKLPHIKSAKVVTL